MPGGSGGIRCVCLRQAVIPKAIVEVTDKPIAHLIYSHAHTDHIGGARSLGGQPIIVAHAETTVREDL